MTQNLEGIAKQAFELGKKIAESGKEEVRMSVDGSSAENEYCGIVDGKQIKVTCYRAGLTETVVQIKGENTRTMIKESSGYYSMIHGLEGKVAEDVIGLLEKLQENQIVPIVYQTAQQLYETYGKKEHKGESQMGSFKGAVGGRVYEITDYEEREGPSLRIKGPEIDLMIEGGSYEVLGTYKIDTAGLERVKEDLQHILEGKKGAHKKGLFDRTQNWLEGIFSED